MGEVQHHQPVLLFFAIFSGDVVALQWARDAIEARYGEIVLASELFDFTQTDYYEVSMGPSLKKQLIAVEKLVDPAELAEIKHQTNTWEREYADIDKVASVDRPLNIDPGYLTLAKLVLATTKDRDHRLYIGKGMFAEVTLHFQSKQWSQRPWTYPDYMTEGYHAFLNRCRMYLRERYGVLTVE